MAQDWNPGGAPMGDPNQPIPQWPTPAPPMGPGAPVAVVSPRWGFAIFSLLFFWPLGIAACVQAAKVTPALQIGDVATALRASNLVRTFFWICFAVFILVVIIIASGTSGNGA